MQSCPWVPWGRSVVAGWARRRRALRGRQTRAEGELGTQAPGLRLHPPPLLTEVGLSPRVFLGTRPPWGRVCVPWAPGQSLGSQQPPGRWPRLRTTLLPTEGPGAAALGDAHSPHAFMRPSGPESPAPGGG